MKKSVLIVAILALLLSACNPPPEPTPTPTNTPVPTSTSTNTPEPTVTNTPEPTNTLTPAFFTAEYYAEAVERGIKEYAEGDGDIKSVSVEYSEEARMFVIVFLVGNDVDESNNALSYSILGLKDTKDIYMRTIEFSPKNLVISEVRSDSTEFVLYSANWNTVRGMYDGEHSFEVLLFQLILSREIINGTP